ncbi:transposase [Malacoplasma iowae]|uniref:transposase n=1 Tax=Malacoplasma iowae TaxID=2116 RepID=UPI0038732AA0|nr:transposase [Malacoplasma iowae]
MKSLEKLSKYENYELCVFKMIEDLIKKNKPSFKKLSLIVNKSLKQSKRYNKTYKDKIFFYEHGNNNKTLKDCIHLKNLELKKYPYTIKLWKNNFDELAAFFDYPSEIRKMICTTNTIENLNINIRKITKAKSTFTNTQSLSKIIYMCLINIQENYDSGAIITNLKY